MTIAPSTPPVTINFPTHPTLNNSGQFNKIQRSGTRWALLNTTTLQTKELVGKQLTLALEVVLVPTMA